MNCDPAAESGLFYCTMNEKELIYPVLLRSLLIIGATEDKGQEVPKDLKGIKMEILQRFILLIGRTMS